MPELLDLAHHAVHMPVLGHMSAASILGLAAFAAVGLWAANQASR